MHKVSFSGTALALFLALVACEAEAPSQAPSLAVGEAEAQKISPNSPLPSGASPVALLSPAPEALPKPGQPFGGLPIKPAPSSMQVLASQAPPPLASSPTPLPSPGPGQVLVLSAAAEGPEPAVEGALVEAGAAGVATNAQGLATVPRKLGASLVVRAADSSTLVVADWDGAPTTLRLQRRWPPPAASSLAQLPISGEVVDAKGNPVVGVGVQGGDGLGGQVESMRTDGQGRFRGHVRSVRGADGRGYAVFAVKRGGLQRVEGLAMIQPERLGEGAPALRLVLQPPSSDLWPDWPEGEGSYEAEAWVEAANGARCVLRSWRDAHDKEPVQRFDLPALTACWRFVRQSPEGDGASGLRAALPSGDRLRPELLALPPAINLPSANSLQPSTTLRWQAVSGAESYALRFWAPGAPSPHWEGLCRLPNLSLSHYPAESPSLHLDLWAFSGPTSSPRSLLNWTPRALRLENEAPGDGRWSWRRLRLTGG